MYEMMYFVDRQKIEQTLQFLEGHLETFEGNQDWSNSLAQLALERLVQASLDSVLDTGNAMIDGFIMRDPGSYEDIIDILLDERVIDEAMAQQFKNVIPLRKSIVQEYIEVNHDEIKAVFSENLAAFKRFSERVRTYLTNELGPVSAFKN